MCGICGYFSTEQTLSDNTLRKMNQVINHRGPDANGIITFNEGPLFCGMGHVRLSIIDLKSGNQPMCNEDGSAWIVYNGEVYNHQELRRDLEKKGHVYKTKSDTETILHLYEEYGEESPHYLRGMFAYAIWDLKNQRLFLVRDRLGIKPLYYANTEQGLVFSSEVKSILKSGWIAPALNREVIPEYFSFGYLTNEATLYKGIRKLMPGYSMTLDASGTHAKRFWNARYEEAEFSSIQEVEEKLREMFFSSVQMRMMSDVPLGMFLSGGLDSSAIAGIMSQLTDNPLKAFTIGYEEKYYSESGYAKLVANTNGMDMYEVVVTPADFVNAIEKLIWHNDMPIHFPASVALFFVSQKAQEHVKVVLTGEGSDELFGGYGRYVACHWNVETGKYLSPFIPETVRRFIRNKLWHSPLPMQVKKLIGHSFLYHSLAPENIIFDNYYKMFLSGELRSLITKDFIEIFFSNDPYTNYLEHYNTFPEASVINRMLYTDTKTYLEELLMKQDKMSMAASIESRVPFLDHKLVEYAATLPANFKIRWGSLKYVIKKAVASFVPDEVVHRPKMGFPVPLATWMKEPLFNNYLKEILLDRRTKERGMLNADTLSALIRDHERSIRDNSQQLWMVLNFELWFRQFLDTV